MPGTFCVVGHDARQLAAARVLRRAGYGVTAADNAAAADYILLPMSQGRVSDEVARALQGAGQGTLILAGRPGMPVRRAAQEAGLPLIDYFLRPELECLNAVPTAEGCLELLLRLRERTIWESGFLVLGFVIAVVCALSKKQPPKKIGCAGCPNAASCGAKCEEADA